jgi:hypothetical protein
MALLLAGTPACGPTFTENPGNNSNANTNHNGGIDAAVRLDGGPGWDAFVLSDARAQDAGNAYLLDGAAGTDACPSNMSFPCDTPLAPGCLATEICNNGLDDNCNGVVDENCSCAPGAVQPCFLGPPNRASVGACVNGTQTCQGNAEFGHWGPCQGGIWPTGEICDNLDNDCNGCVDDGLCCSPPISCPSPGDIADGQPFTSYQLDGTQWYTGIANSWSWDVQGGPCDDVLGDSFTVTGGNTPTPIIEFTLSGDYTVTMTVDTPNGVYTCTFIIHVVGPGVRVELCWEGTGSRDIDLHMLRQDLNSSWCNYTYDCYYSNCKGSSSSLPDWGYSQSLLSNCSGGPMGSYWTTKGYCHNPRLDIDNISTPGIPENINVDNPNSGDVFRVMVHYYSGGGAEARPLVNIYCDGHRVATYGQAPNQVSGFTSSGSSCGGHTWRVADIATTVSGGVTTCNVSAIHPPGQSSGFYIRLGSSDYN